MSARATFWAWEQQTAKPTAKLVLLKLADNANDDGLSWPGKAYLARHTGLSETSVKAALKLLETDGLVRIIRRKGEGDIDLPNHYQLNLARDGGAKSDPGGNKAPGGGGRNLTPGGAKSDPEPTNQPTRRESDTDSESTPSTTESDSESVGGEVLPPGDQPEPPPTLTLSMAIIQPVKPGANELMEALRCYQIVAERRDLPKVRTLTKERARKLSARLHEHGLEGWKEALRKLDKAGMCHGENDRGWRANIDFLLQPSSFVKLLEGAYDTCRRDRRKPEPGIESEPLRVNAAAADVPLEDRIRLQSEAMARRERSMTAGAL